MADDGNGNNNEPPANSNGTPSNVSPPPPLPGKPTSEIILGKLGLLYMQLTEVINNMSRTASFTMKAVLLGSFVVSALGLNKPSASIVHRIRHLLNEISTFVGGPTLGGPTKAVVDILIALGEQYFLYYFVQWAVEHALCLENSNCDTDSYIHFVQTMKIDVCGREPYRLGFISSNHSYCHLAFNTIPFAILLIVVGFLYAIVTYFGGKDDDPTPHPAPAPFVEATQSIDASCPTCKKGSELPFPNPAPAVCTNCTPGSPPGPSTSKPTSTSSTTPTPGPSPSQQKPLPPKPPTSQNPGPSATPTLSPSSETEVPKNSNPTNDPPNTESVNAKNSSDFHNCILFTDINVVIPAAASRPVRSQNFNVLSNTSNRNVLVAAIYKTVVSNFSGGSGGGDSDNDDDDTGFCELTQEDLAFLRITILKMTMELFNQVAKGICLPCHDKLCAVGLCACPSCERFHGQDDPCNYSSQ